MKKVQEFIKPFLTLVFGALFLLVYMNYLAAEEGYLAIGIIGVTFASVYIGAGVVELILGEKLPAIVRKIISLVVIASYGLFLFTCVLIDVIYLYEALLPTGWVIAITSLIAFLAMPALFIVVNFVSNKVIYRIALIVSAVFALALILRHLFQFTGLPDVIGNISLTMLAIDILFALVFYNAFKGIEVKEQPAKEEKKETKEEKKAEEPKEEPKEESKEEPKEEAPEAEQPAD